MSRWVRAQAAPLGFAALALGLHLACGGRLGFFRDELYFVACGQRPAWGYVDQPPLGPLLARLGWWLSGDGASVLRFRLPAVAAHLGAVLVAAALARRLSGGPFAAALAAAAVAVAPIHLAQGHLVGMNALELLLWPAVALCAVAGAQGRPRAWPWGGLWLGLAMLAKYSGLLLAVALLLGLLATRGRATLRSGWLWAGVALAAALALPAALWQAEHGLPFLELWRNGRAYKNVPVPATAVLGELLLLLFSPAGGLLIVAGLLWLLRARAAAPVRFLGAGLGLLLVAWLALGAKPYYLAPAATALLPAGAVWLEGRVRGPGWRALALLVAVAAALPGAPLSIPILSPEGTVAWQARLGAAPRQLERLQQSDLPQHLADQLGWPEQAAALKAAVVGLSPEERAAAVIYAPNYGRAAAAQLLGRGLPPVISGHNQYFLWGVPGDPRVVLAVGGRPEDYRGDFAEVAPAGRTPAVPHAMPYESAVPLWLLRGPRAPVAELLRSARHYE